MQQHIGLRFKIKNVTLITEQKLLIFLNTGILNTYHILRMVLMSFVDDNGSIRDPYKNFIHISRYARWLEDKNRRETWTETVDRYISFMKKHLVDNYNYDEKSIIFPQIHDAILNHKIMPSMRALMTAGPALERDNIAAYNCFVGNTMVITKEYGSVPLNQINGEKITAWTSKGWKFAEAKYFGEQDTQRIIFRPFFDRSNHRLIIDATPDHRWILSNGTQTTSLSVGDKVMVSGMEFVKDAEYDEGVRHGIIFGDGSMNQMTKAGKYQHHARLCGSRQKEMLTFFEKISYPESANGDPYVYHTADYNYKELPLGKSPTYIAGFIYGWLLADGNQIDSDFIKLDSQFVGAYEWMVDNAPYAGLVVTGINYNDKPTNFGERSNPLARISLRKSKEFIVESISELDNQDVYCLVVPETGDFTLSNGMITGNCSFIAVDSLRAFDEAMYILMNGTGVGFSVEQKHIENLPVIADEFFDTNTTIVVEDSKLGWAKAYKELIGLLVTGQIATWDMSKVRPAGARLKIFGGRASGPDPLSELFRFTVDIFRSARGRRLKSIEAHDIMCKIGEVVVVGGVRRSALISLSNLDDFEMAKAKSGQWWESQPQRALANNSAVYHSKPNTAQFLREWRNLYESKSGERGIYNMDSVRKHIDRFGRRDSSRVHGTNPCGEILLRPNEFCNLTEVVIEANDTVDDLLNKVRLATILGTWQSTLTNFKYIRKSWRDNCEEERLLGVSLTGIFGNKITATNNEKLAGYLDQMRELSVAVNEEEAKRLGINPSASITCVKPSGTVSQLTGVSSGIHPWYSPYYLRSVRADNKDPLTTFLKESGIPNEPDVMKPDQTTVFYFPIKAPKNAVVTKDISAIEHLEIWKTYREHWTEHNPSVTINVKEDEWIDVSAWVYKNFDYIGGVSFLPSSEHTYRQAPYQEITEKEYNEWVKKMPSTITWQMLSLYEFEDTTTGSQELSCVAGACEIVDISTAV
jgi:ribonucleoside-triphosphate reductase